MRSSAANRKNRGGGKGGNDSARHFIPAGDDSFQPEAVVALDNDTGEVGRRPVGDHHPARPRRVPDEEKAGGGQDRPVDRLPPAGLEAETFQVTRVAPPE